MQQRRLPRMKRRVEPEPALGRKLGLHVHVGDKKAVAEDLALPFQAHQVAQRAAGAVGRDHVVGFDAVAPVRRVDLEPRRRRRRFDADRLVLPAHLMAERREPVDQRLLEVILLQVDERRPLVAGLGQQVELVRQLVVEEHLADLPADAVRADRLAAAQPIEHLERALRVADRARADAYGVVVVDDDEVDALLREIDRRRQPDRAGTDDRHLRARHPARRDLGRRHIRILRSLVCRWHSSAALSLVCLCSKDGRPAARSPSF